MYQDHKTARDRVTRRAPAPLEISTRTLWLLSLVVLALFCLAGSADFNAVQAGLI